MGRDTATKAELRQRYADAIKLAQDNAIKASEAQQLVTQLRAQLMIARRAAESTKRRLLEEREKVRDLRRTLEAHNAAGACERCDGTGVLPGGDDCLACPAQTVCETCGRATVEPVVDPNEGFAFCGQCAVALIGGERDLLRNALAGLLPFARGNQPVLDRIHAALDDTTGSGQHHRPDRLDGPDCMGRPEG